MFRNKTLYPKRPLIMTYQDSAKKIIKEHIKTAIYIDENAREPFTLSSIPELFEEKLSLELYKEFANHNILLNTYKFDELKYNQQKDYLLNGRDFVLLDWKLEGEVGEDKALNIISDIISAKPKISFCGVYTKEQPEVVFKNMLSYFSGITDQECDDIKLQLLLEEEENIREFISELDELVLNNSFEDRRLDKLKNDYSNIFEKDFFVGDLKEIQKKLIECWCAYSNYQKANTKQTTVSSYKLSDFVLLINNTFIVILNKTSTKFNRILNKFTRIIADYSRGFSLLMSLEMNNFLQQKGLMLDPRIINVSQELFAYHKMQDKAGFDIFIKDVILNGISLELMDEQLSTIQSLKKLPKSYEPKTEELVSMYAFYDSIQRFPDKNLLFGDVFKYDNGKPEETCYYICITPLCDCANPKNENTFYFAKGHQVIDLLKIKKEIKNSEEIFISYLPDNTVIKWAEGSSDKNKKDRPVYITPIPLTVPKTVIKNNRLCAYKLKAKVSQKEKLDLQYVGTIKQNYAQRIANHAFMHSIRVGISFASFK